MSQDLTRRDRILDAVRVHTLKMAASIDQSDPKGIDAQALADQLGLNRANVSRELNALYNSGQVVKFLGKPTFYLHRVTLMKHYNVAYVPTTVPKGQTLRKMLAEGEPVENADRKSIIEQTDDVDVGLRYSLYEPFKVATSALIYPAGGLPMLLSVPDGCSGNRCAHAIHEYAVRNAALNENAPFIECDCSIYRNAQTLLLTQLFGEAKGSGQATARSRRGLLERAAGGVLCLEHIEALDAQMQSSIASLTHKPVFSRVREADVQRTSNAVIIALTNLREDDPSIRILAHSLPIHIAMPPLDDCSSEELLNILAAFFQNECENLKRPLHVSRRVIECLLGSSYPGNAKQLRDLIRGMCALSWQEYMLSNVKPDWIHVGVRHLTSPVLMRITDRLERVLDVQRFSSAIEAETVVFAPGTAPLLSTYADALRAPQMETAQDQIAIPVLLCCHGEGVAPAIAAYINRIYGADILLGLTFSPRDNMNEIARICIEHVRRNHRGFGALLLCDMEPLDTLGSIISTGAGVKVAVRVGLNTAQMIALCGAALRADRSVDLLIEEASKQDATRQETRMEHIMHDVLAPSLIFLDVQKAINALKEALSQIERELAMPENDDVSIRFMIHSAHMLERLIRGNPLKYDALKAFTKEHYALTAVVERAMRSVGELFGVTIPASELAYLVEMFADR